MKTRRQFLTAAAASATSLALANPNAFALVDTVSTRPKMQGRFLTHVSIVRVNQIEVTPTKNIGEDEAPLNSPDHIRHRREAFAAGWPGGQMTWAISWLALIDTRPEYREARQLLVSYHHQYGDEITFIPGGYFAPMYATRADNQKTIHDALEMISKMVGNHYRPQSLVAGYLDADSQHYLATQEGIHVCQGQIWSQHGIDNGDGDGGICYPYYPSREHYLKPAQGKSDFIDCVCLDGWTCDFLPARREGFEGGFNSRLGVGPIETGRLGVEAGHKETIDTVAQHFDQGYALNGFAFVTSIWEVSIGQDDDLTWSLQAIKNRWPDTQVMTEGAFGLAWRSHHPSNAGLNYRFDAKGTGAPGSEKELEIQWFMNTEFRLALLRHWQSGAAPSVIDFTRYDLPAHEPQTLQREWSLMNVLNQKGTRPQDKPIPFRQFPLDDQHRILAHYPELKNLA
ncbi:DUF3863 domain-containing protein [Acidicapsa acidisoli]|uniref:DUF3863 domain-containing protein n=1 Tax=Acidicapsa acidisoli TaxID=1615681 RepID=UPI0021E0C438|nr:DUF3863 domain-containing protein [Acidicapsa acidisoli]